MSQAFGKVSVDALILSVLMILADRFNISAEEIFDKAKEIDADLTVARARNSERVDC